MAKSKMRAFVETITLTLYQVTLTKADVGYILPFSHLPSRQLNYTVEGFPLLRWKDSTIWFEANIWLSSMAQSIPLKDLSIKTIQSLAMSLLTFMRFCESEGVGWNYLPIVPAERAINRYRRFLIESRESGAISPSTASAKMSVIIRMYRWCMLGDLLTSIPFETKEQKLISFTDRYGRVLTKDIDLSNLRIRNKKVVADRVEGGLQPVSLAYRNEIIAFARHHLSYEMYLMLRVSFESGLRVDSLSDLKVNSVEWAFEDSSTPLLSWISVGPSVNGAPVRTKFGVNGRVIIGTELLVELKEYAKSKRRLLREVKAPSERKELLFLTSHGNSYARAGNLGGSTLNSLVYEMKKKAKENGKDFDDFHFHRARATFGVSIVSAGIDAKVPLNNVLAFARDLLLHADVRTTMTYVAYVQNSGVKMKYANEYTAFILGQNLEGCIE